VLNSGEIYASELRESAHLYRNLGWSVIPIWGDSQPEKPKAAAINWSDYQFRRASSEEIDSWFSDDRYGGLALICGSVSKLAVLDFDRDDMGEAFARCCPDLAQTFTVRSGGRGLPHYYYRVPSGLKLLNKRINGADFQAQSTYVVAPPTVIDGKRWEVSQAFDLVTLSQHSVNRIRTFLDTYRAVEMHEFAQNFPRNVAAVEVMGDANQQRLTGILGEALPPLSNGAIQSWYQNLATEIGRNNALLKIAIYLRDSGWTQAEVIEKLVEIHIIQPPSSDHPRETPVMRRREAVMTINSAFKRPVRQPLRKAVSYAIPNSIREKLLQLGCAAAARVLDGLLLAGIQAGMIFTERMACTVLKIYGIGRRAVQEALCTVSPKNQPLFKLVGSSAPPVNPPKSKNANAAHSQSHKQKKCAFVRGANRIKTAKVGKIGCPSRWFMMPDSAMLCRILDVKLTHGDPIHAEDLKSPKAYRQALQRGLCQRRPATYSRQWLCQRLGISVWTCRRYDRQIGLHVAFKYQKTPLTWEVARSLPFKKEAANGIFIERSDGKRFPPIQGLALSLLRRFRSLSLTRQHWNFYRYGPRQLGLGLYQPPDRAKQETRLTSEEIHKYDPTKNITEHSCEPDQHDMEIQLPRNALWLCPHCLRTEIQVDMPDECKRCKHATWEFIPESIWKEPEQCKKWWQKIWNDKHGKPFKAQKTAEKLPNLNPREAALADRLYEAIRAINPDRALARALAYEQVQKYGVKLVEWMLGQLSERTNIANPAGFVITVLRSEHKFGHMGGRSK
jgi:Bifunctional DNA primase/polymerase, N-terminal